ncbi:MAG: Smr/MutS family protein [Candidatus Krumholzibacteria bacterium]|nr:Smr/MutS family protein [Candidatus Krumholzibacteria bacterium]
MINLLDRMTAFQESGETVLGLRAGDLLEWESITGQVASFCLNAPAVDAVLSRRPHASLEPIVLQQAMTDELRVAGDADQWPPMADVGFALDLVRQPPPVRLEGPDLVHVAGVAEQLDLLRAYFLKDRTRFVLWGEAAVQMADFSGLSGAIRRALDRDGSIVDGASPLLARLRRAVVGQERAVRQEIGQAMSLARAKGWTTGDEATLRGDRFCLPLRSGDSRRIEGIVHDRSSTGATLFVEPAGVVRLSNELTSMRLEIATEEARILFELNRSVEQAAASLGEACEVMILLDTVRAPMLWSRQVRGHRPVISASGEIRICGGRHPLLMDALGEGDLAAGRELVVPLDLEIPSDKRALVISGPNAGGKSVALKSVGVFCLLAQCGWDVPAREDTILPMITRLLVDLGDEQSIAQSLSSFSAHLQHLGNFMAEAGAGTLVLCDEIGSGTDPQEGTALAFAVLTRLIDSGALVLASTHFGLLKAAVHDHPRMVNAAMDYDERDLRPLFTFRVGDPGTSHAFDIAARMGFPDDLLDRARRMAGEERVQIEKLLADLDRRARELTSAQEEVKLATERAGTLGRDLDERLRGLRKERRDLLKQASREAEDLVRQGRRAIEQAVREIKVSGADREVVKSARNRLESLKRKLSDDRDDALPPAVIEAGQRVRIPHLGLTGTVVEVRGDRILATADGLRLTLGREAVRPLEDSPPRDESAIGDPVTSVSGEWAWHSNMAGAEPEIDLRGETGEEGWERLDKLIDRAIPAGLEVINVIHGFGTGRLRDHLHERLKNDPRVASFREAGPGQGGGGATLVTLAG